MQLGVSTYLLDGRKYVSHKAVTVHLYSKPSKFVSSLKTAKPKFKTSELEYGRSLPRPERKKYFKQLKEIYLEVG